MGHSVAIANKHYWQVTEDDFANAACGDAENDAQPTQKATQQRTAENRTDKNTSPETIAMPDVMRNDALCDELSLSDFMGDTGFEPVTSTV